MIHPLPRKCFLPLLLCSTAAFAAETTWDGIANSAWTDDGNWSDGAPANVDTAIFSGTPTANQPDIGAAAGIRLIDLQSAGWTITSDNGGSLGNFNFNMNAITDGISSAGSGVNIINANVNYTGYNDISSINVDTGNTLVINGSINNSNRNWQTTGSGGTFIFNGAITNKNAFHLTADGSYLFNGSNKVTFSNLGADTVISSGNFFGGTSDIGVFQYTELIIQAGATLSPGGNGATIGVDGYDGGDKIATVTYESSSGNRAGISMSAGSFLSMDIGGSVGVNDQINIGASLSDDFDLNGATLALYGATVEDGLYTLMTAPGGETTINGSFDGDVLFNGVVLDPSNYTLTKTTSLVTIELTGLVPEPSTYALIFACAVGAIATLRRKR